MLISGRYYHAIREAVPNVKFDLILYATPPITICRLVEKIKKRDNAFAYLLLKDIWPQGPIDLGALSTSGVKGLITKYFQKKEHEIYKVSDFIGCMSPKNCEYIIKHSGVDKNIVEICPNSIRIREYMPTDKDGIRTKIGIPRDKLVFVYGGNLGVPQGVDFIIRCLEENERSLRNYILIIGAGTEYDRLNDWFEKHMPRNSKLIQYLPQDEYNEVVKACDVGLIFLDHRFSIPNFPSRLLSYMEAKLPILAATDPNTDVGNVIEEGGFGYWCESDTDKVESFTGLMQEFSDEDRRRKMGENAYRFLTDNYSVTDAYKTIMEHLK